MELQRRWRCKRRRLRSSRQDKRKNGMKDHLNESTKHILDGISVVTVLGALVDVLPAVAALFTIIWTGIRIYETATVQKMLGKKNAEHQ